MCTVVLRTGIDGDLELIMNRDERLDRAAELPPRLHRAAAGRPAWIGPVDGERGGTWIGVNGGGVAACILNAYVPSDLELLGRSGIPSRGEIVPRALAHRADDVLEWAQEQLDPRRYPSFVLVLAIPGAAHCVRWLLGCGLEISDLSSGWSMVTSSLWRPREVVAWREAAFQGWLEDGTPHRGSIPEINLLTDEAAPEHSPLMTRPLSATRSVTSIRIEGRMRRAVMRYWQRRPDRRIDAEHADAVVELPL